MRKATVLYYYSGTGNTEKMAKAVVKGFEKIHGLDVELKLDYEVTPEELGEVRAMIIGMPTYYHDMTRNMKRLLEETAVKGINLKGKIGACFGSYGWSGEAPRLVLEILENRFDMEVIKPPLLIKYAPDTKGLEECYKLGKNVAERILGK